jgi:hypothetical protein
LGWDVGCGRSKGGGPAGSAGAAMRFLSVFALFTFGFIATASCNSSGANDKSNSVFLNESRSQTPGPTDVIRVPSKQEIKQSELQRSDHYDALLRRAPLYHSEVREKLANNIASYRQSYRSPTDDFWGLSESFRCIHPPRIIERAQKDGWQLVKCDSTAAVFFRSYKRKTITCEKIPIIPELYETLTIETPNIFQTKSDFETSRATILRRGDFGRPARGEVSFDHPYVAQFYKKLKSPDPNVIPESVVLNYFDEMKFYDTRYAQVITLFSKRGANGCTKNPLGEMYLSNGSIALDTPSDSFFEMSSKLKQYAKYLR